MELTLQKLVGKHSRIAKSELNITTGLAHQIYWIQHKKPFDVAHARELFIKNAKIAIGDTNEDRFLRASLTHYPSDIYNFQFIYDFPRGEDPEDVKVMFNARDQIFFVLQSGEQIQESYREAALLVNPSDPVLEAGLPFPQEPQTSQPYFVALSRALRTLEKQITDRGYPCEGFLAKMLTGKEQNLDKIRYLRFEVSVPQAKPLHEARALYHELSQLILDHLNHNKEIIPHYESHPYPIENLELILAFKPPKKMHSQLVTRAFSLRGRVLFQNESRPLKEESFSELTASFSNPKAPSQGT